MKKSKIRRKDATNPPVPRENWRELLNGASGYASSVMDKDGYIYKWSPQAEKLTGYSAREVIGRHDSIFYTEEDVRKRVPLRILERAARRGLSRTEGWRVGKGGKHYWTSGVIAPIYDKKGKLRGYGRFTHNATKEHELNRQKDEFLGIVAHELKTPITILHLYAHLLKKCLQSSRHKENLKKIRAIEDQSARVVRLVNSILNANAIKAGEITIHEGEFDVGKVAQKVANEMSVSGGMPVRVKCSLAGKALGDASRIEEVLVNLLSNAVKYSRLPIDSAPKDVTGTAGAERTRVSSRVARKGKIDVFVRRSGIRALVAVRDYGPGIRKEHQKAIFHRYWREGEISRSASGLGLGLYISSGIIRQHGQKLWVRSELGQGSTFYFTLALAK